MAAPTNIVDLANRLIVEATTRGKTAETVASAAHGAHPIVAQLKAAAAHLRTLPDEDPVSLEMVQKIAQAIQPGTGAQSPGAGQMAGGSLPSPKIPSLQTSNLGVVAGGGGAPASAKVASDLRKIAAELRASEEPSEEQNTTKAAHILNAALGLHYLREGFTP